MFRWLRILASGSALLLGGCLPSYSYNTAKGEGVPGGATVSLSVVAPDFPETESVALEGYLRAALIQRGYRVMTSRTDLLVEHKRWERAFPEGSYSPTEGVSRGLEQGGEVEGDAAGIQSLIAESETTDALRRYSGLEELLALSREHGAAYLLVVERFAAYGYSAQVLHAETQVVALSMVVSADRASFSVALDSTGPGRHAPTAKDGDASRLHYMRLASHIAALMR